MPKNIFDWLLAGIFFLLPWQTRWIFGQEVIAGQPFEFGVMSLYAVQILVVATFFLVGSLRIEKENIRIARLAMLILVPALGSVVWAISSALAFAQTLHVAMAMMLFVLLLDARVNIRLVVWAFCLGLVVPSLLGMWQFVTGASPASTLFGISAHEATRLGESVTALPDGTRMLRAHGSFQHPNVFGGYLSIALVGLWWLYATSKNTRERWGILAMGVIFAMTLLLTFSQSAWLALVMAVVVGGMVLKMKRVKLARALVIPVAGVFIAAALGFVFVSGSNDVPLQSGELEQRSSSERVAQYNDFFQVMDQPHEWLLGHGLGNYLLGLEEVYPWQSWWLYQPIHNVPLLILGEIGLIGVGLVLLWSSTIDKRNFARFPNRDAVVAFMMGNVVLFILFFDHYLWSQWAGLSLISFVMALTVRMGETPAKS